MSTENDRIVKFQARPVEKLEYQQGPVEEQVYYRIMQLIKSGILGIVSTMSGESDPNASPYDVKIKSMFATIARVDEEFQLDINIVKVMTLYHARIYLLLLEMMQAEKQGARAIFKDMAAIIEALKGAPLLWDKLAGGINILGGTVVDQGNAIQRIDRNTLETREMLPRVVDVANGNMAAAIRFYNQSVKAGLSNEAQAICDVMLETGNKVRRTAEILKQRGWPHMSPSNVARILKNQIDPKFRLNNPFARTHARHEVLPDSIRGKVGHRPQGEEGGDSEEMD